MIFFASFRCSYVQKGVLCLLLGLLSVTVRAEWLNIDDNEVTVYFQKRNEEQARHILGIYRQYMPIREAEFEHKLKALHLLVLDATDLSNGFSTPIPRNVNGIFLVPPTEGALLDEAGWLHTVINHETVHLYHLDKVTGTPKNIQSVFGRNVALFPALFNPNWLLEGLATFIETDQTRRIGRGSNGYFDAIMRLEYERGFRGLHNATYNARGTPPGVSYYYGYYFFEYLHTKIGSNAIFDVLRDYSGNIIPYMLSSTFEENLGVDLAWLWNGYRDYLRDKFGEQLQTIRTKGVHEGIRVSSVNSTDPRAVFAPDGSMYYRWRHPYTGVAQIRKRRLNIQSARLPTAKDSQEVVKEKLEEVFQQESIVASDLAIGDFDVHPHGGLVYSALAVCDQPDDWKEASYYDLYLVEPGSSDAKKIFSCKRYSRVRWHPDGRRVFGLRYIGGLGHINLLSTDGKEVAQVYAAEQDEILGSFAISRNAETMAISRYVPGLGWDMYLFDISSKVFRKLTNKGNTETMPVFGDNDKTIIYTSNRGGVYNIRQVDIQSGEINTITNTTSLAFSPALAADGKLYFSRFYSDGFAIHQTALEARDPVSLTYRKPVMQQHPATDDYKPPTAEAQPYSLFTGIAPTYWFPVFSLQKGITSAGLATGGADILTNQQWQLNATGVTADYTLRNNYEYEAGYQFRNWFQLAANQKERVVYKKGRDDNNLLLATQAQHSFITEYAPYKTIRHRFIGFAGVVSNTRDYYQIGNPDTVRDGAEYSTVRGIGVNWLTASQGVKASVPSVLIARVIREQIDDGHTSIASSNRYKAYLNQYIHITRGHFLSYVIMRGEAEQDNGAFAFGSADEKNSNLLPSIGTDTFPLLGYERGDAELTARTFTYTELAWNMPGDKEGIGFMVPPVGVGGYRFRLLAQHLNLQYPVYTHYRKKSFSSVAAELRFPLVLGYYTSVPIKIVIAKGLNRNGRQGLSIMTDYAF